VATLRLKSLQPGKAAANTYDAVADLTIKGITNEIKFPVVFEKNATGATATADITIDRTKWNVVYKSKTVFSTLGDKFIYDDMYLTVKLALKQ
jgi:polyisoprenoid-binding protein YceI